MSDEACGKDRKRLSVMLAEAVLEFVGDKGAKSATKLYIRELHCSYRAFHPTIHVSSSRSYIQSLIINLIDSLQEGRFLEANDIENLEAIGLHRTSRPSLKRSDHSIRLQGRYRKQSTLRGLEYVHHHA